jgi:hypothetical protein
MKGKAMRRTLRHVGSMVFVVGLALIAACNGPNRSQNPSSASGRNITISISPNTLRGATAGTSESQGSCGSVVVKVFDVGGRLVDGAAVSVTTTLGRFPPTGPPESRPELVGVGGFTVRGIFSDVLCAKAERGTGTLTATTEDAQATVQFTVF